MTLSERNRASLPETEEDRKIRDRCMKFLKRHEERHPRRQCLQSLGNQPMGTSAVMSTDYGLFTPENPEFLAVFEDDSEGYLACRPFPKGNGIIWFEKPVVWEVKNGHVRPPKRADEADFGMYIEAGDVEETFLFADFTVKQWDKMISDGNWCIG
jgi:hypothetical protein